MKMNNFLLTGCAGFIGSHALDLLLSNGHTVIGIDKMTYAGDPCNVERHKDNKNFKFFKLDICETEEIKRIVEENNIECIINFAAETHVDNSILGDNCFISSNVTGVKSLLEICKELNINICHISTDEVYGPIKSGSFQEHEKLSPKNFYSATKAAAEHLVTAYSNTFGIDYVMIRMSNNYGPRQNQEKFLPTIIRSLKNGDKIPLYGDGKNVRDWIYVKDSVRAIYNILQSVNFNNEVYNISFQDERNNIEVIETILKCFELNWDDCVEFVADRLGHDSRYSITNHKMLEFVDFEPTPFKDGISDTIEYYNDNLCRH
jgi:dTDP-glucose 4,6-dehydratase